MADVLCVKCHNPNSPELTYCRFCGTRLPKVQPPPPPPPPPSPPELQKQHEALQSAHAELQGQHQDVLGKFTDLQQLKQQAENQIEDLLTQVEGLKQRLEGNPPNGAEVQSLIAELQQKLKTAEQNLQVAVAKIQKLEASPVGQLTRPLWTKILSWGLLPLIGSAGGLAVGAYSGLNPYKVQLNKTLSGKGEQERQLQSLQSQLTATTQQLDQEKQQLASEQQNNTQMTSQMSDLQKSSQTSSSQLTGAKNELASAKTQIVKDRESIGEKEQQLQAARAENQQLTAKAAQAAALQEIINHHPYLSYKGPTQGVVTVKYTAKNDKPLHITIDHFHATSDSDITIQSLSGVAFPAVPLIIEPTSKNTTISSPPSVANGWQKVVISVQGKGSSQAVFKWSVF